MEKIAIAFVMMNNKEHDCWTLPRRFRHQTIKNEPNHFRIYLEGFFAVFGGHLRDEKQYIGQKWVGIKDVTVCDLRSVLNGYVVRELSDDRLLESFLKEKSVSDEHERILEKRSLSFTAEFNRGELLFIFSTWINQPWRDNETWFKTKRKINKKPNFAIIKDYGQSGIFMPDIITFTKKLESHNTYSAPQEFPGLMCYR